MTICHIDLSNFYNAPEKQLEILIQKLSEVKGCKQKLFYRKKLNNRFGNNPKISPEMVMMFQMKMNMYENIQHIIDAGNLEVIEFEKLYMLSIRKEKYIEMIKECQLIHSHDRKSTILANYLFEKYKIPYVLTYHKPVIPDDRWYYKLMNLRVHKSYENASKIITVSNYQQKFLKKWNSKLDMKTIYNTPSFYLNKIDKGESNFFRNPFTHTVIIGLVGKHMNIKNYELVVDVALRYIKKAPDIQFILIGEGLEGDAILREKTVKLFNFKMQGYIINIEEHIEYFDAFILPSKNEALGATIVDMMELGKPVIASNVGGIPELIEDGVNGYLFNPDSVDELEEKIDKLIGDPILVERLKQMKLPWLEPIHYGESTDFIKFIKTGKEKAKELSHDNFLKHHLEVYREIFPDDC